MNYSNRVITLTFGAPRPISDHCISMIPEKVHFQIFIQWLFSQVEHIIREDYMVEALEILELFCDLLLARFGLIETMA